MIYPDPEVKNLDDPFDKLVRKIPDDAVIQETEAMKAIWGVLQALPPNVRYRVLCWCNLMFK